ncbi:hypothetical protein [Erwinia pyrifoliae]|uniref:hypothetical protein n=1 Tax=Erwinia pyrifoliae TaxID=79967 RepID=UPI00220E52C9|nr:hypothetical protein [Erwinia pyrifoliae]UWS29148.1 hypothetical protein NYP81_14700 [Erwinia pyrifoliae]
MSITGLDSAVLYIYNKVYKITGKTISDYDARKILYQLRKVENNPVKMAKNKTSCKALHYKMCGTKNDKLHGKIKDFLIRGGYLPKETNFISYIEHKESEVIVDNTHLPAVSEKTTTDHNMSERMAIAKNIYYINKKNFIGERVRVQLVSEGRRLKWQSGPDLTALSSHEKPKKTNFLKKKNKDNFTQLVDEKKRSEVIMEVVKHYQELFPELFPELISKETRDLIDKYNKLKPDEAKKTDSQRSENKTDEI